MVYLKTNILQDFHIWMDKCTFKQKSRLQSIERYICGQSTMHKQTSFKEVMTGNVPTVIMVKDVVSLNVIYNDCSAYNT